MAGGAAPQRINTYVFTDLVGSTRLTRALPAPVWRRLKDRHDALVRDCAVAAGGQVVKALGDGFLVVFPAEEPAVSFAVTVQRAILAESWSDGSAPEVRIGMDTGPALYRADPPDFEGDAVNIASHICARARPGEILLSARAFFGARPWLDRGGVEVRIEPVGEVRLKGLPTLEPLFRAWAPGLREGYPPLTRVGNLTAHRGAPPFVDRLEVLDEIVDELRQRPIVTLLGPGGMGKTRLATEVGARLEPEFPAGVWFAPLEAVRRGEAVAGEILAALGLPVDEADPEEALLRHLDDWRGLLILDNLEQLADEPDAPLTRLLSRIARRCAQARLLCTSRIELRLGDSIEGRVELPPLLPPTPTQTVTDLMECPSAQLCVERLRLRVRQFTLDDSTAPHVAAICRATEGIPLLIELAAGQFGRRTLPQIARDIERVLVAPSRDADRPDRHRDLTRLLDWSVDLLGDERAFFLRLGVFRGGFDAEAAARVTDEPNAESYLEQLVDAHLVCGPGADDYMAERPRYRLHGATAAYCRSRLVSELLSWRRRHADYYAGVSREAAEELAGGAPPAALTTLARERENLAAALDTALETEDLSVAAAVGGPLWELLHRRGLWPLVRDDARRLLEIASRPDPLPDSGETARLPVDAPAAVPSSTTLARAVATMALAQAAHDEGRVSVAHELYESALELWRSMGDEVGAARALHGLGNALRRQEAVDAERAYEESLEIAVRLGDIPLRALNLMTLGLVASQLGRGDEAEERHAEAVSFFRQWDDPWVRAIALNSRAQNLERLGQLLRARDLYAESLEIKRELYDRRGIAITLLALARLAPRVGDPEAARALILESLQANRELGDTWGCAVALGSLAERCLAGGEADPAVELAAAALEALRTLGGGASAEAAHLETLLASARSYLPSDQAEAREQRGRESSFVGLCDRVLRGDVGQTSE